MNVHIIMVHNRVVICENKGVMGKVYPSMFYCENEHVQFDSRTLTCTSENRGCMYIYMI